MAIENAQSVIKDRVAQYVRILQDHGVNVSRAYLFGSHVSGSAHEWSDIDVALVTDRFQGDSIDFKFFLTRLTRKIDPDIEPHPYLEADFNDTHPLPREILRTGELIYQNLPR
ncbi:nucleotidyltransferase domain-containing protein [Desulfonatronovibrio magnus]|uniref:nucleotidyltransferase domain-containing protein n=1 Tax=Desulfonatronovibrio magnus TaxID=698827 RepID=UPI0005EBA878|nr:nucleotidyltransferase domain-containing protein [Desulfonatronovibrio magnus]